MYSGDQLRQLQGNQLNEKDFALNQFTESFSDEFLKIILPQQQQRQQSLDENQMLPKEHLVKMIQEIKELKNQNNGQLSQFYTQIEAYQQKYNKNVVPQVITIKDFRRPQKLVNQFQNSTQKAKLQQQQFEKKYINFKKYEFDQFNPIELTINKQDVYGSEEKYELTTYRQYSRQQNRKGIVFYLHGFGDYAKRYAYLAQPLSEAGYDFCAMDQKGFGFSEGMRGYYDTEQNLIEDNFQFIDQIIQKYEASNEKIYLFAHSLGAQLALKLAATRPKFFNALALVTPFIYPQEIQNNHDQSSDKFNFQKFEVTPGPRFLNEFRQDPQSQINMKFKPSNIEQFELQSQKLQQEQLKQLQDPFLMFLGGRDQIICNESTKKFYQKSKVQDKNMIMFEQGTHELINEKDFVQMIVSEVISFYNSQL